jgi:hypothetical protein
MPGRDHVNESLLSIHALRAGVFDRLRDQRRNEVARAANQIRAETGCTRTEALFAADQLVPL